MAYMNQEKKAKIKAALDPILKARGFKYSLRVDNHMAIVCTIQAGPLDIIGNWLDVQRHRSPRLDDPLRSPSLDELARSPRLDHLDVNHYWISENFSGESRDLLLQVKEAMKAAAWYDRSDAQVDYFDTAYYYSIKVGRWDKGYKYTGPSDDELEQFIADHFEFVHVG